MKKKNLKPMTNKATIEKEIKPKTLMDYTAEEFDRLGAKEQTRLFAETIVRNLNTHDPKEV